MKIGFVIPARFASSRFPGKPLAKIKGVPMLLRTYRQCAKAVGHKDLYVATDSKKIIEFCKKNKIKYCFTSSKCLTGTDRVAEFSKKKNYRNYINIQGDEPIFNPKDLKKLINETKKNPHLVIGGYCKIKNKNDFFNPNIPKVIFNEKNHLLYMSRSPVPGNKKNKFIKGYRQVCVYSYPKKTLNVFYKRKNKPFLEKFEDLELLGFLEKSVKVKMIEMSNSSISVDHPEDIKKVEKKIKI
tara:strand:+ start:145 stop:867 length:723 start_codon:yes stop_codon:yes gene_type:complete